MTTAQPVAQPIRLNDITFDRAYQLRVRERFDVIVEWAEEMKAGAIFPPIRLMRLPSAQMLLIDGFHRTAAARRAGLAEFPALIEDGTSADALFAAAGANTNSGISLTNEDKRKAARAILANPELYKLADREIERRTKRGGARGLSHTFISQQRRELDAERAAAAAPGDAVTTDRAALRARLERHIAAGVTSIPGVGDPAAFLTVLDRAPEPRAYAWLAALDRFESTRTPEPPCPAPSPPAVSPVSTSAAKAPAVPPATGADSGDSATAGGSRTSIKQSPGNRSACGGDGVGGISTALPAVTTTADATCAAPCRPKTALSEPPTPSQLRDEAEHLLLTLERRGVEYFGRAGCQAQDVVSLWLEGLEQETAEDLLAVLPDLRAAVGPAVGASEPEEDEDAMTARALDNWRAAIEGALDLPEGADLGRVVAGIAQLRQERDRYANELARRLQAYPHTCTACSSPTDRMEEGDATAYPLCWLCALQAREEMIAEFRAEGARHHAYVESTTREIADLKRRAEQVGDYAEAATQDALMSQLRTALGADEPERWSLEGWQALLTRVELHATRWMDHVPPIVQHSLDAAHDRARRAEQHLSTPDGWPPGWTVRPDRPVADDETMSAQVSWYHPRAEADVPTGTDDDDATTARGPRASAALRQEHARRLAWAVASLSSHVPTEPICPPPPPAPAPPPTPSSASDDATPAPATTPPQTSPAPASVTTSKKRKTASTTTSTTTVMTTATPSRPTSPPDSSTPTAGVGSPGIDSPRPSTTPTASSPTDADQTPTPTTTATTTPAPSMSPSPGSSTPTPEVGPRSPEAPATTEPALAGPADPTDDPTAPEALRARIGALLARGETMLALEGRPSIHLQVIAFNIGALGPDAREELHEALAAMEATAPTPREPRWLARVRDRLGQESDEDTAWAAGPHVGPQDVARERERLGIHAYQPPPDPLALYRPWTRSADELAAHLEALPRAEWEVVWRAFGSPSGSRVIERVTVAIMAGSARSA